MIKNKTNPTAMIKLFNKYFMILMLLVFSFSCSEDSENTPDPSPEIESRLVSSDFRFTRAAGDIRGLLDASGFDLGNEQIQYDVQIYGVTYNTKYGNQDVVASGMVFIPEEADNPEFFSFQHGTVASDNEVPTNLASSDIQLLLYAALSASGMIVVVPDFIGFGASNDIMHPYYVEQPSADAVLDNIRAAAELAISSDIEFSDDLYLSGYSQGGYVTMAAHKAYEEQGMEFFDLKASFPSSGGYEIEGVRDFFFDQVTYGNPFFLAFVAEAYRTYYNEADDFLSLFFQEPYATDIPDYFTGEFSGGTINGFLTDSIASLINPEYLTDTENAKFDVVNDKMRDNSLTDWTPSIPVYMYHGNADITVPYQNSIDSYNTLISNGASETVVTFTTLEGATHGSGFFPYIVDVVEELTNLREQAN